MSHESEFFRAVASRNIVRVRVAGIVIRDQQVLVQRPVDDPHTCYAFIGGEYEVGDTFDSRIRREFAEETTARVIHAEYRFVVENRFQVDGRLVHSLEHYFEVEIDRDDVCSNEPSLQQRWLPLDQLTTFDIRPRVVRDVVANGEFRSTRHRQT